MKLVYSIPEKLYYIQNFLDFRTYKKIHYDSFKSKLLKLSSVDNSWQKSLVYGHKNFTKNSKLDINYKPLHTLITLIKNNPYHRINNYKFNCMFHSMEDEAGINWHDDGSHEYGITYYINRRWNPKFGGEFLFSDVNVNGFIPLVGNSLIIVKTPLIHKVVNVTKPLVSRKTIQIFVSKNE
jgi:Rps23 Pro-64 3,4-dihydroxylase Tpa1-like proline 4-hydroxylase|tara:strand:+ start:264 stop:806 length:543 start_codon:yes stop_codon:yes gene_type:complete